MITPNAFANNIPYWLYADFPVVYDPCTCSYFTKVKIEASLVNSGKVDILINSLPYQSPVKSDKVNGSTDFLQGFSDFSGTVEGGLKATASTGEAFGKLNDAIAKQTNLDIQNQLNSSFSNLQQGVNDLGNWVKLIPVAGAAVNSLVSLIDFFSSGGKTSSASPSPVIIVNNFKATGTISSASAKNSATFYLPGSDQTGKDPSLKPSYNNVLGIFNLLNTPKVTLKENNTTITQNTSCGTLSWNRHDMYFFLTENLKYVVNPVLNIDISKSNIRAAFFIENCDDFVSGYNLHVDLLSGGKPLYRSSYFPLGSVSEGVPHLRYENRAYCVNGQMVFPTATGECTNPKVYIKIIAQLRRFGSTSPSEDIMFIAKYPVNLTKTTTNQLFDGGLENLEEDIYMEDNYNPLTSGFSRKALNIINMGQIINSNQGTTTLNAGEAIILRPGAQLVSGNVAQVGNIYSPSAPTLASLQATSSDLISFCGSSTYTNPNNISRYSVREASLPEQIYSATTEEAFSAFPNPTNGKIVFRYYVEEPGTVGVKLLNLNGQVASSLVNDFQESGAYEIPYDLTNLPNGIYIYTVETGKVKMTKKIVLIH